MPLCSNCEKFALLPQTHGCINCPKFCNYKEQKWCDSCSVIKNICSICGKTQVKKADDKKYQDMKDQVEKIHPFYNHGCKSCGGR